VDDDRDPIGELVRLLEILSGEQQRRAIADELTHDLRDLIAAAGIEAGCWLVEKQDARTRQETRR
jgi:hypothetical protein